MTAKARIGFVALMAAMLGGCNQPAPPPPDIRPVRAVAVEHNTGGDPVSLTGHIQAQDQANLAFRLGGRMIERPVNVGDNLTPGELVARLDPQPQQNALRSAQANLSASQGTLTQAQNAFDRQNTLLQSGFTTRAQFDSAQQALQSAKANVDSAQADLQTAQDQLGYTELKDDAAGVVTAVGAQPGEVVTAGEMIVQTARQGGRDAVFDVPSQLIRSAPPDPTVQVVLENDTTVKTTGRVREVSPQADPVTGTFQVKIGLTDPPRAMSLGSTVVGTIQLVAPPGIVVPATALTETNNQPAVWVFDPKSQTVALRNIEVARYDPSTIIVSKGIDAGEVVVTAGVQALHPGQKVRLLGANP